MRHLNLSRLTYLDAFGSAMIAAAIVHAFFILSVTFRMQDESPAPMQHTLDVILVNPVQQKTKAPDKADFLAATSQEGGAEKEGQTRPAAPAASLLEAQKKAAQKMVQSGVAEPAAPSNKPIITSRQKIAKKTTPRTSKSAVKAPARTSVTQLLASTQQEINRLTAEVDKSRAYASYRPRRKAINASTKEYKYASYLHSWRKKVERIGNLNYPDEARRKKLHGNLLLHVAVRADGSVQKVRVVHSSGHQALDDAAVRIVKLAAPFAPFPPEVRKEVDVIDITRTWQFLANNSLFTDK